MAVLALDLATHCGWAVFSEGMDRPFFGSLTLKRKGAENGEAFEKLRQFLAEKRTLYGVTHIIIENQHIAANTDRQRIVLLMGFAAMVEWFCHRTGIIVHCVEPGTWRKHFIGHGRLKRAEAKKRCMDQCNLLGWYPPDDDAGDACGILDFYLSLLEATPMGIVRPWRDSGLFAGYRK